MVVCDSQVDTTSGLSTGEGNKYWEVRRAQCFVISACGRRVKLLAGAFTFTSVGPFTAHLLLIGHKEVGLTFCLLQSLSAAPLPRYLPLHDLSFTKHPRAGGIVRDSSIEKRPLRHYAHRYCNSQENPSVRRNIECVPIAGLLSSFHHSHHRYSSIFSDLYQNSAEASVLFHHVAGGSPTRSLALYHEK